SRSRCKEPRADVDNKTEKSQRKINIPAQTVNGAALFIATCDLLRSVDRKGKAIPPVVWNGDRVGHSIEVGEHRLAGISIDLAKATTDTSPKSEKRAEQCKTRGSVSPSLA